MTPSGQLAGSAKKCANFSSVVVDTPARVDPSRSKNEPWFVTSALRAPTVRSVAEDQASAAMRSLSIREGAS